MSRSTEVSPDSYKRADDRENAANDMSGYFVKTPSIGVHPRPISTARAPRLYAPVYLPAAPA
jgi:hypothetical protein